VLRRLPHAAPARPPRRTLGRVVGVWAAVRRPEGEVVLHVLAASPRAQLRQGRSVLQVRPARGASDGVVSVGRRRTATCGGGARAAPCGGYVFCGARGREGIDWAGPLFAQTLASSYLFVK
jgi:hypothetical protein